jgi:DNA segregation ATPase FtsK/SpoIIIE, S-DNA-T family
MFSTIVAAVSVAWLALRILVLVVLPTVIVTRLAIALVRFAWMPPAAKRNYPAAVWARFRWRALARRLDLARPDPHRHSVAIPLTSSAVTMGHRDRLLYPRARFRAGNYGLTVQVRTIPGVGREQVEAQADHLANALGAWRVSVAQPRPRRLEIRAFRRDPLTEPFPVSALPPFNGRHVTLGRDEDAHMRPVSLAGHSGSCWSGSPGRGKTECGLALACQLASSPAVEWFIADGGELDWTPFENGAARYETELDGVVDMLHQLAAGMNARRRNLQADLGVRNGWAVGPSPDYPLRWLLMEEAPAFLQVPEKRGKRRDLADEAHALVAGLLRRGRAPLYHTSLVTQKATTTGGLHPDLRDLCGLRWSFGVATVDGAASILGADIREHPTMCPTLLQGPEHVGVASALLPTGKSPYTLLRFPEVGQERADRLALELARRRGLTSPARAQEAVHPDYTPA